MLHYCLVRPREIILASSSPTCASCRQHAILLPTCCRTYPILECSYHMMRMGNYQHRLYYLGMESSVRMTPHRIKCSTGQRQNQNTSYVDTWLRDINGFLVVQLGNISCWHMVKVYQGLLCNLFSYSSRDTTTNISSVLFIV